MKCSGLFYLVCKQHGSKLVFPLLFLVVVLLLFFKIHHFHRLGVFNTFLQIRGEGVKIPRGEGSLGEFIASLEGRWGTAAPGAATWGCGSLPRRGGLALSQEHGSRVGETPQQPPREPASQHSRGFPRSAASPLLIRKSEQPDSGNQWKDRSDWNGKFLKNNSG